MIFRGYRNRRGYLQTQILGWILETDTLKYRRIGVYVMALFFYWNIFDKKFFLVVRLINPNYMGRWGYSVFRCFTVRYKFSLSFDPNFEEKSWDISTPILKNFFFTPSKKWLRVSIHTFLGELHHRELEYAVFLPNLLTTYFLILTSL